MLVHTTTNELYHPKYTKGEYWVLSFDDQGFGFLVNERWEEHTPSPADCSQDDDWRDCIAVEDVLKYAIYDGKKAGYVIFCNHGPGKGEHTRLASLLVRHAEHTLKCIVGAELKAEVELTLFQFRWPRQGTCLVLCVCVP